MKKESFASLFAAAEKKDSFWTETAILEFTAELYQLLQRKGMTKADLARAIGTSQAYVTKVFRGDANFTIETMVRLTRVLGGRLHIHIAEENAAVRWFDLVPGRGKPEFSWKGTGWKKIDHEVKHDDSTPVAA